MACSNQQMTNPTPHQPPPHIPDTIPGEGFDPDDAQIPDNQDGSLIDPEGEEADDDEKIVRQAGDRA
jgi:hypothetical protein